MSELNIGYFGSEYHRWSEYFERGDNVVKIEAFNDFWLDCYTTMLYSVLLSANVIDKVYIYNNNYKYELKEEEVFGQNEKFNSVCVNTDTDTLKEKMFKNEQEVCLYSQENPIDSIKTILSKEYVLLLSVDLFYWVDENYHYRKNHIVHFSLVKDYDDSKEELIVLETGNGGYQEYAVPYDKAVAAIRSAKKASVLYEINSDLSGLMYTKQDIVLFAKDIISSIDSVYKNKADFLNVNNMSSAGLSYVNDILQTHLFIIQNREKVNRHLFMIAFENDVIEEYSFCDKFEELEQQFEKLKNVCVKNQLKKLDREVFARIKQQSCDLLLEEKKIWSFFLEKQDEMTLREF